MASELHKRENTIVWLLMKAHITTKGDLTNTTEYVIKLLDSTTNEHNIQMVDKNTKWYHEDSVS